MIRGKKVLLVDDNEGLRDIVRTRLEYLGYQVFACADACAALRGVDEWAPHVIVLDMQLPQKGGLEFLSDISTPYGHTRFPVLIVSGHEEFKDTYEQIGASGFLSKPFEIEQLAREVERITILAEKIHVFVMDLKSNPRSHAIVKTLDREKYRALIVENMESFKKLVSIGLPDFILMEYMQQESSGEECIRQIRNILRFPADSGGGASCRTPILVYSLSGFNYGDKCLAAGADRYLGNPENNELFLETIREFEILKKQMDFARKRTNSSNPKTLRAA